MANEINKIRRDDSKEKKETNINSPKSDVTSIEFALIALVAVGKDGLDAGATLSIIGVPLTPILNIGAIMILWLWCVMRLKEFPTKRFAGSAMLEFLPFLNALPFWTAFLILIYIQQNFPNLSKYIPGSKDEKK
ncbi:MAG: hypothetical protein PHQ47_00050 [Candidatus Portnoybacteria bacterium]|nr:hypothetical protein [Candidatus Portnoybacteria bacterium]